MGQTEPHSVQKARGLDRCEGCRAQHVRCDGVRPVCKRCQGRGLVCSYPVKRPLWTVYTNADRGHQSSEDDASALSHHSSTDSTPEVHSEPVLDDDRSRGPLVAYSTGRSAVFLCTNAEWPSTYASGVLYSSPSTIPTRWDWSDIRADVHALMVINYRIEGRHLPGGFLKEIVSSKDLTISNACLTALYQSILGRRFEADPVVLNIRGSVLQFINSSLRRRNDYIDDSTIISIIHQMYYDCFMSSKSVIFAHLNGLHHIVRIRGGLRMLGLDGDLAHMLKIHILMACVITEVPPPTEYLQFRTRSSEATESVSHVSLMYCPLLPSKDGDTSPTLMNDDPRGRLQRLILHLRQFTTSFLSSRSRVCQEQEQLYDAILQSHAFDTSSSSPHIVWVYESCRIAGVVFAAAIRYQVPFSTAVPLAVKDSGNASLLDDLYHAIYRSPYSSRPFWGEWAGAFLWVSLVSASISLCGSEGELWPHDKLYREMKLRRTSLAFPFVFATKLFHIKETSRQAFMITETMIRIQEKLAASSGI